MIKYKFPLIPAAVRLRPSLGCKDEQEHYRPDYPLERVHLYAVQIRLKTDPVHFLRSDF